MVFRDASASKNIWSQVARRIEVVSKRTAIRVPPDPISGTAISQGANQDIIFQ